MSEGLNIALGDDVKAKPMVIHGDNLGELISISKEPTGHKIIYRIYDITKGLASMREIVKDISIQHKDYNYNFRISQYNYKLEAMGSGAIVTIEEIYEEEK